MILIMRKIYLKLIVLFYVLCCNTSILFAQKDMGRNSKRFFESWWK